MHAQTHDESISPLFVDDVEISRTCFSGPNDSFEVDPRYNTDGGHASSFAVVPHVVHPPHLPCTLTAVVASEKPLRFQIAPFHNITYTRLVGYNREGYDPLAAIKGHRFGRPSSEHTLSTLSAPRAPALSSNLKLFPTHTSIATPKTVDVAPRTPDPTHL
jgi:hypothetical protein